jgi:hypothetical protein
LTGNVLVEFDKRLDSRRIAELLQDAIRDGNNSWRLAAHPRIRIPAPSGAAATRLMRVQPGATLGLRLL